VTRSSLALFALLALAAATPARAGAAACWFENGVVVVPAEVMGVSGDYILDTATPHTLLAETQAQTAGFAETALNGEVRLAGVAVEGQAVAVADLDMRTGALPTPIAGVIGADVLKAFVLDVSFSPCRVALIPAGHAPRFAAQAALPMSWIAERPVVTAAASDGAHIQAGAFTPGTGADVGVRISDAVASAPGAAKPKELYPYGVSRPRLRALSFAGGLQENLPAGLLKAEDPALIGQIGAPLLAHWRLRFDFPGGRLLLGAPQAAPVSSPRSSRSRRRPAARPPRRAAARSAADCGSAPKACRIAARSATGWRW